MSARDDLMLDSMGATPNGFEIKTHAGGPQTAETLLFIADSMRSMLDEHDAPNYLEMEVEASDGKLYTMTLQRQGKITPHQARVNAEDALKAELKRVRGEIKSFGKNLDSWESQEHSTVTIRHLRQLLARVAAETTKP